MDVAKWLRYLCPLRSFFAQCLHHARTLLRVLIDARSVLGTGPFSLLSGLSVFCSRFGLCACDGRHWTVLSRRLLHCSFKPSLPTRAFMVKPTASRVSFADVVFLNFPLPFSLSLFLRPTTSFLPEVSRVDVDSCGSSLSFVRLYCRANFVYH